MTPQEAKQRRAISIDEIDDYNMEVDEAASEIRSEIAKVFDKFIGKNDEFTLYNMKYIQSLCHFALQEVGKQYATQAIHDTTCSVDEEEYPFMAEMHYRYVSKMLPHIIWGYNDEHIMQDYWDIENPLPILKMGVEEFEKYLKESQSRIAKNLRYSKEN